MSGLLRTPGRIAAVLLLAGPAVPAAHAQDTKVVTVGPEDEAGYFQRVWLGEGYRDLWTTPVRVPVLDLGKEAGGLTPVRQVGQAQSVGLAMRGADGRAYTFRSLHKEPDRMLPEAMRGTMVGAIARDLNSGTHPAAGLILPTLAEAAGVAHTTPRLVVMPDAAALGAFRPTFANMVGTIEEFPLPAGKGTPGFMGATEIVPSTGMWQKWMEGPANRVDSEAYLRARVLDLWVDNYDRHRGQWRWMRVPGQEAWQPLPEDPDFVLVHRDGLVARSIRSRVPQYLQFSAAYPGRLDGALLNSAEMDRWILAGLEAPAFEAMARDLQSRFTDQVIERALRQMPPEWYAINGASTAAMLRTRRAGLVEYPSAASIFTTPGASTFTPPIATSASSWRARPTAPSMSPSRSPAKRPRRTIAGISFPRRPTRSGSTCTEVMTGSRRRDRPGGRSRSASSPAAGRTSWTTRRAAERTCGATPGRWRCNAETARTCVRHRGPIPWPSRMHPGFEPRSYGKWTIPGPIIGYAPDVLVYVGYGFTRTAYGFGTTPAKSIQTVQGAVTTGDVAGKFEYIGTFYRPASRLGYRLQAFGSGVESYNYFGHGNDSPSVTDRGRYKTGENVFFITPTLRYDAGRRIDLYVGPELRYSDTPTGTGTIVAEQSPLGVGRFGIVALRAGLAVDSRERSVIAPKADYTNTSMAANDDAPVSGVRLQASGFVTPAAWDVPSRYGGFDGLVAAYLGNARAHLAVRAGGRKLWGDYAWFDAASVGGSNNRGFSSRRFSGDASAFGSASVRAWLGQVSSPILALRFGVVGFGDIGRVWLRGEDSNTWHSSLGGGLLVQPAGAPFTMHATAAHSREGTRFYVGMGYPF